MPRPDEDPPAAQQEPSVPSYGNMSDNHWSRTRQELNKDAIDYYRERSKAPGVAEGGALRNHYCLKCNGVIPLEYDQRKPLEGPTGKCPHCGAELEGRVRAMFNWVETDQVPGSDLKVLLPLFLGVAVVLGLAAWGLWALIG